jgi:hypothetical protein
LNDPPEDFNICPSCGTEFGADTVEYTLEELQAAWIERGMEWTIAAIPQPSDYDPLEQLQRLAPSTVTATNRTVSTIGPSKRPSESIGWSTNHDSKIKSSILRRRLA